MHNNTQTHEIHQREVTGRNITSSNHRGQSQGGHAQNKGHIHIKAQRDLNICSVMSNKQQGDREDLGKPSPIELHLTPPQLCCS